MPAHLIWLEGQGDLEEEVIQEANLENDLKVLVELEEKSEEELTYTFQRMETVTRTKSNRETPGTGVEGSIEVMVTGTRLGQFPLYSAPKFQKTD